jgi:adenosine deaminase
MKNILVATIGPNLSIILEMLGFVFLEDTSLLSNYSNFDKLKKEREKMKMNKIDELWIITTDTETKDEDKKFIEDWLQSNNLQLVIKQFFSKGVKDIKIEKDVLSMRELIYRVVLFAEEESEGNIVLCLAGGRKTMASDLYAVGQKIGCKNYLNIILSNQNLVIDSKTKLLPKEQVDNLVYVVEQGSIKHIALENNFENMPLIQKNNYLLLSDNTNSFYLPKISLENNLVQDIDKIINNYSKNLVDFHKNIREADYRDNWQSLYLLTPKQIRYLREEKLSMHIQFIYKLPKADLHRHIGGSLTLEQQIEIGKYILKNISEKERKQAYQDISFLNNKNEWDWDWTEYIRQNANNRTYAISALLESMNLKILQHNLYEVTKPRVDLKKRFSAYERPGECSGSALLSSPLAWEKYINFVIDNAIEEGLEYFELRVSPQKYSANKEFQFSFFEKFFEIKNKRKVECGLIPCIDRRTKNLKDIEELVELILEINKKYSNLICGIDLAGDESWETDLKKLAEILQPLYKECISITIHSGEGESVEKIWEASYLLQADRIGHGLSLLEDKNLLERFNDRSISIELCPTSNEEVVGYFNIDNPRKYPLRDFLGLGVCVVICTDNPTFSHTNINNEYLVASKMCADESLSLWEALLLIKNSFSQSFASYYQRKAMLKTLDNKIFRIVGDYLNERRV